jgi:hypothetical protein
MRIHFFDCYSSIVVKSEADFFGDQSRHENKDFSLTFLRILMADGNILVVEMVQICTEEHVILWR